MATGGAVGPHAQWDTSTKADGAQWETEAQWHTVGLLGACWGTQAPEAHRRAGTSHGEGAPWATQKHPAGQQDTHTSPQGGTGHIHTATEHTEAQETQPQRHRAQGTQGHRHTGTQGQRATETPRHKETQRHRDRHRQWEGRGGGQHLVPCPHG